MPLYTQVFLGSVKLKVLGKAIFVLRVIIHIFLDLLPQFFLCWIFDIIGISIKPCAGDPAAK